MGCCIFEVQVQCFLQSLKMNGGFKKSDFGNLWKNVILADLCTVVKFSSHSLMPENAAKFRTTEKFIMMALITLCEQ